MANITTYLAGKLLDHGLGDVAFTKPACFAALFTTNPTMPAGTGAVEVSGGSYGRVALAGDWAAAASGSKATSATVAFATATADWGLATGVGIYDASSAGNLLWAGPLAESKTVSNGDTFQFNSGQLSASLG